ncbi:MAG: TnpV protein [Acutalibacteraceae bacterium]
MTDTLFEQFGGTYTQVGDYLLPYLSLPAEKETGNISVWALRHKRYLKQHHKVLYYNLLTSGKLHSHLADIEEQAQQLFLRLVKELAEKEGVTEQLKAADQMAWVRKMNNIRECVKEIINKDLIVE